MEKRAAVSLTKSLLREFYEFGSMANMLDLMDDDVIGFGIKSRDYNVGKQAIKSMLEDEYAAFAPCRIIKMNCTEKEIDGGSTVRATVVFQTKEKLSNMHQVLIMFRLSPENIYSIRGVHWARDVRHEMTYRVVSAGILGRGTKREQSKHEVTGLLSSYVSCAYVTYSSDSRHTLSYVSDELWQMLGYDSADAMYEKCGDSLLELVDESDRERLRNDLSRQLLTKNTYQVEYRMRQKDERILWIMECGRYVSDERSGLGALNGLITNITPLKRSQENMLYTLHHDSLTDLPNKTAFYGNTEEMLAQNPDIEFEIMCMDVNRFKVINDLFGEETGDKLLQYVAGFLRHLTLTPCTRGRLHSDNFAVCYPVGEDTRRHLMDSLRMLAASFALDYRVDFSFGIYTVTDRNLSVSAMVDRASLALTKVGQNGITSVAVYEEKMRDGLVNEQVVMNNMQESLEREDFLVYLQPKYDLMTEHIVGAEALVRWMHPKLGFISPDKFIPVFEQNGFIYRLDLYVWEKTCQLLRKHIDSGMPVLPISINVSRVDIYCPTIIKDILALVQRYDLEPRLLELELTESAYVDNPRHIIEITKELQSLGFPILMDDFGSGYSSLNMLKDMPVDVLKIDLKFLSYSDGTEDNGRGSSILNSVVRMAKWLHMPVIAEGVETRQQVDFLRTIGCERAQGYYYSKPVPVDVYEKMLRENAAGQSATVKRNQSEREPEDTLSVNAQLNVLFNSSASGIGLYELTGEHLEILRANDEYFKLFGDDRQKVYGAERSVMENIHPADRQTLSDTIGEAGRTHEMRECIVRRFCADDRIMWVKLRISIIFEENSRRLLYLIMEDVTEAERKRVKLKAIERDNSGGFGVYELAGGELILRYLSDWLVGINREDVGDTEGSLYDGEYLKRNLSPVVYDALRDKVALSCRTGQVTKLEYPFLTRDDRSIWLRAEIEPIGCDGDNYICYAFINEISAPQRS